MASVSQSPVNFSGSLSSATSASDLLRSSINGVNGVPLQTLGRGHVGPRRKGLNIVAKVRKVKKQDYPWPQDPDPNVKGGVLSHLSPFKPLKEKPKPVTLEFEKPLMDLQKKIIDVQKMANETVDWLYRARIGFALLEYAKSPTVASVFITVALSLSSFSQSWIPVKYARYCTQICRISSWNFELCWDIRCDNQHDRDRLLCAVAGIISSFLNVTACLYFATAIFWNLFATGERVF